MTMRYSTENQQSVTENSHTLLIEDRRTPGPQELEHPNQSAEP